MLFPLLPVRSVAKIYMVVASTTSVEVLFAERMSLASGTVPKGTLGVLANEMYPSNIGTWNSCDIMKPEFAGRGQVKKSLPIPAGVLRSRSRSGAVVAFPPAPLLSYNTIKFYLVT